MLATRGLRRYLPLLIVTVAAAVAVSLALIPGLSETVSGRTDDQATIWDRQNLARAAVNMVEAKPLFGFGWSRFAHDSADYFQQSPDYPLIATSAGVHNTPLTYAVELGLIGMTSGSWAFCSVSAVRSPHEDLRTSTSGAQGCWRLRRRISSC
jgi:O-antigen ligase